MGRVLCGLVLLLGALLALGVNVTMIVCDATAIVVLGGVVHYLFLGRLPGNFWPTVFGLFFGPILLASLLRAICRATWNYLILTFGVFAPAPIILGVLFVSFLAFMYVRPRVAPLLRGKDKQNFINERKPILPPHLEEEDDDLVWTEQEKELDSPKEYSDED